MLTVPYLFFGSVIPACFDIQRGPVLIVSYSKDFLYCNVNQHRTQGLIFF